MKRRTLLRLGPLALAGSATPRLAAAFSPETQPVRRVLAIFKCHLDVGFTQTQAAVMRRYFDVYFPAAVQIAADQRAAGADRYTWTTGSWLLYEYLEQATAEQKRTMEQAIERGEIAWHALPFSWQSEMVDRSMVDGALGFAASLDARFGKKTIAGKMTDVPGHTRGLIAPLAAAGVELLDIGVNAASTPPDVPEMFVWKDSGGRSLTMMYHRHDYGGAIVVPGSDLAVSVNVRNDNMGPHTPKEIAAIYAELRARYPGAEVRPASLSDVALAVRPYRAGLPVVTEEIGDTWIYGIPSDPPKVARYREAARLRRQWIGQRRFAAGDATDRQLLRRMLLSVEHTWGTDTKTYLDNQHYRPADLASVLGERGYRTMETSWQEKRDDLELGLTTLPEPLRAEAETRLARLKAVTPQTAGMSRLELATPVKTPHFELAFDPRTGAITRLVPAGGETDWASPEMPLGLFTYQTLSAADFAGFLERYIKTKEDWAPRDFGKPGIEALGATSQEWHPHVVDSWTARTGGEVRITMKLRVVDEDAAKTGNVAWPEWIWLEYVLPDGKPTLELRVSTFGKRANRMPEAMWLSFQPQHATTAGCRFSKIDEPIAAGDVVPGGSRTMHALSGPIQFAHPTSRRALSIDSADAPVAALGRRTPLNFSLALPDLSEGVHFSLYNNAWGTNYPQWCQGDWCYRFTLSA